MNEEEVQVAAAAAQELRKQKALEDGLAAEREAERIKQEQAALNKRYQEELVREQQADTEDSIEQERQQDIAEGDRAQTSLQGANGVLGAFTAQVGATLGEAREEMVAAIEQEAAIFAQNVKATLVDAGKKEAQDFLESKGYKLDLDEIEKIREKPPTEESFPFIILVFSLCKDILDILDLTFFGIVLKIIYVPIYFGVMTFWTLSLSSRFSFMGKIGVKILRNIAIKRLATTTFAEALPVLSILPLATVFVLLNHYSNKKIVQYFMKASEMIAQKELGL
jgi:hypothetical protein